MKQTRTLRKNLDHHCYHRLRLSESQLRKNARAICHKIQLDKDHKPRKDSKCLKLCVSMSKVLTMITSIVSFSKALSILSILIFVSLVKPNSQKIANFPSTTSHSKPSFKGVEGFGRELKTARLPTTVFKRVTKIEFAIRYAHIKKSEFIYWEFIILAPARKIKKSTITFYDGSNL